MMYVILVADNPTNLLGKLSSELSGGKIMNEIYITHLNILTQKHRFHVICLSCTHDDINNEIVSSVI